MTLHVLNTINGHRMIRQGHYHSCTATSNAEWFLELAIAVRCEIGRGHPQPTTRNTLGRFGYLPIIPYVLTSAVPSGRTNRFDHRSPIEIHFQNCNAPRIYSITLFLPPLFGPYTTHNIRQSHLLRPKYECPRISRALNAETSPSEVVNCTIPPDIR